MHAPCKALSSLACYIPKSIVKILFRFKALSSQVQQTEVVKKIFFVVVALTLSQLLLFGLPREECFFWESGEDRIGKLTEKKVIVALKCHMKEFIL